ncbi:MAG: hypothetical protein IJS90_07895 [Clostridia bacterium]|nr:hypothetical protein [Clostridia bacterium]
MKKTKKIFAVLLAAVLTLCVFGGAFTAFAAAPDYAVIYLRGSTDIYKYNSDGTKYTLYGNGDYLSAVMNNMSLLLTGSYDAYAYRVLSIMKPAYDPFRPSLEDGSVPGDTHVENVWSRASIVRAKKSNCFEYFMDDRLSPFVLADDLHDFINTVKDVTGKSKIFFYARCLGPVLLFTYLYKYERPNDYSDLKGVMLSFSTHEGMAISDAMFTGNVNITSAALDSWMDDQSVISVSGSAGSLIMFLMDNVVGGLGSGVSASTLNRYYGKLKYNLFKPLLKEYYALRLSYMACVNERFDEMMGYLFSDEGDDVKYSYAISQMRAYHNNVYPVINDMLSEIKEQGKNVIIFADYGGQQYPVSEESEYLGDFRVGTKAQSIGATVSKVNGTLTRSYIESRKSKGLGSYISADAKVDASTCRFPDNTFFVSNVNHTWTDKYKAAELKLIDRAGFDINYDSSIPQFLFWDEDAGKLVPLSDVAPHSDGSDDAPSQGSGGFFSRIIAFITGVFARIRDFFVRLF